MDIEALQAELERLHPESYGWALSCCARDSGRAQEVLQNAYLKILSGRARFNGQSTLKTWLLALIRNTAADAWRCEKRDDQKIVRLADAADDSAAIAISPSDDLEAVERKEALLTALRALPARQQEVLRLVFYHDLTLAEAADVMGISLGSVRTHYERGKERLRQLLNVCHELGIGK